MNFAPKTLALAGFAVSMALPGFAQESPENMASVTCSEFMAMTSTEMAEVVVAVRQGTAVDTDAANTGDSTSESNVNGEAAMDSNTVESNSQGNTAGSATTESNVNGQAALDSNTVESNASNETKTDATGTATTAELGTEELVALAMANCTAQPDAMISDVLQATP